MATSWIPTQDRILVKIVDKPTETDFGITIAGTESVATAFDVGEIIAIGQYSVETDPFAPRPHAELKVGRRALFYKEQGLPVPITEDEDNVYAVLHVNDIYFVSDDPEATISYF